MTSFFSNLLFVMGFMNYCIRVYGSSNFSSEKESSFVFMGMVDDDELEIRTVQLPAFL